MSLLKSTGIKRLGASGLIALSGIAYFIPGLGGTSEGLAKVAGALGAVGIGHAAVSGSDIKNKLATFAAFLAALAALMEYIPSVAPYAEYVKLLAGLLGAGAIGSAVKNKIKK